ncbi:glutathione S-transferase [Comamonas serinivorans]|uniref:Glutathione S-transferase n=1 Tax=Comamonas serinivorans TaxID=1082851 RepID=A0A1Y0EPQ9_9BURK|nr:glutathione S-transferase [Comamonas serinivorans]ARU05391.1 glutathione S-transferase [Comamonas serinivorans]
MTDLTLYTHPMSRGRATRWMLEETRLPYDEVILDWTGSMKSPAYLAINPMGKVPALRHGDVVVTENAAIALYLADLVPELQLAPPPGSAERGTYYRWMLFLAGPFEALLTARQAGALAPPTSAGYGQADDTLHVLQQAVRDQRHLVGNHFTMLDLYAAACLGYYMQVGVVPKLPEFEAYVAPHLARPACTAAASRDNALAAALPTP